MTMTQEDDDLDDLLPDDLKGSAVPLKRGKKAKKQIQTRIEKTEAERLALAEKDAAARLAQIVNLHIAGMSLAEIGAKIGATADEVDRMIAQDAQRYVRSQPALRVYVRNYISEKYSAMLAVNEPIALDPAHEEKLEHQDRNIKILDKMAKLHGADSPVQSEVKVEQAPEAIDRIVQALAAQAGRSYDIDVFDGDDDDDVVDAELVEELVNETQRALTVSGNAVEESDGDDEL